MKSAQQLLKDWRENQALRSEWYQVTQMPSFRYLCQLAAAIAFEKAEFWHRSESDTVLARNLAEQKGVRSVIQFLQTACDVEVQVETRDEEPFGHITADYFLTRNQNQ